MNADRFRQSRRGFGRALWVLLCLAALWPVPDRAALARREPRTRNVVLVLVDGLRWQEVFAGADERLLNKETGGVPEPEAPRRNYWRDTPEARREALMPFLWRVLARQGQLYGNRLQGSAARVTNTFHFSYPGYSEMTVGYADPRIDSNAKRPNPNVTVMEWLHGKPRFRNRVAVFGAWDVVPWIVNRERCGFYVNAAYEPVTEGRVSERQAVLNRLKATMTRPWEGEPFDAVVVESALEYLKANRPRVFWLTLGETDEWAHARRYDRYLQSARQTDAHLEDLWETLQGMKEYRDRTTLIVAGDHGRGRTPQDWTSHGNEIPGADEIWLGVLGPDTPALGEMKQAATVTQSQVAATLAAALGEDYPAAEPRAAPPIAGALSPAGDRREDR